MNPASGPGADITVVGLGPADAALTGAAVLEAITEHDRRFLRTARHPAASLLPAATTFDHVYEREPDFASVYGAIVEELVAAAGEGPVLYAVPGSPWVLERTVELLEADPRVRVKVIPAMSFVDLAWARLGVDPFAEGVRLVDGHRFAASAAGERGPLLVAHCHNQRVLSDIKLSVPGAPTTPVTVLQRLGLDDEAVFEVDWADLDRAVAADHLTALYVPELRHPPGGPFVRFDELVATLRRECPWDAAQTHQSLRRHLLEETYEVLEAIDELDANGAGMTELCEELGDLLFQVCLHARIAAEDGWFDMAEVCDTVHDKLHARHPHVFTEGDPVTLAELSSRWEERKRAEKDRESVMDGIPSALPGSLYALKVQKKAASLGFGLDDPVQAFADVEAELAECRADRSEAEVGDVLFAAVGLSRLLGHDPEMAVRGAARRFEDRFRLVEQWAAEEAIDLVDAAPAVHDELWARAELRMRH